MRTFKGVKFEGVINNVALISFEGKSQTRR
jgi:hypothetical protein